ncbi:CENP-S associating centromere protein X-domain-containing protein [Xylariaceae sp. FL1019]|nr:CENP-S associating centromere protein X-domain-containing protein [Xylariaceae sp. FL1019]
MPANQSKAPRGRGRGGARGGSASAGQSSRSTAKKASKPQSQIAEEDIDDDPFADDSEGAQRRNSSAMEVEEIDDEDDDELDVQKTIPPELLTRILHEFFEKSNTRISKDANKAVAKYMDIFVREAIARSCVEKPEDRGVFLEVTDLEKVAPQLLMDL